MKTNQLVRHKRIIYTGLEAHLEPNEVMKALVLWEEKYSNQAKFSLRYFIDDVSKAIDLKVCSKPLYLSLVTNFSKSDSKLLPDPTQALENFKRQHNVNTKAQFACPDTEAFHILISKWLGLLTPNDAADIVEYVEAKILKLRIQGELKIQMLSWLKNREDSIKVANPKTKDLRKIINLFYVGFCENIGPTRADELLAEAVTRLKNNGGGVYSDIFSKLL